MNETDKLFNEIDRSIATIRRAMSSDADRDIHVIGLIEIIAKLNTIVRGLVSPHDAFEIDLEDALMKSCGCT